MEVFENEYLILTARQVITAFSITLLMFLKKINQNIVVKKEEIKINLCDQVVILQ